MFPIEQEKKLEKVFNAYVGKLLQVYKKNINKKVKKVKELLFKEVKATKEELIKDLASRVVEMNFTVFDNWRTLTDEEILRGGLEGGKKWVLENVKKFEEVPKNLTSNLQKQRIQRIDEARKEFNKTFHTRVSRMESGGVSKRDIKKMKDTLNNFGNKNSKVLKLINDLDNHDNFTKEDFKLLKSWSDRRNELWARDQTGDNYSTQLLDLWAENKIESFIWMTEGDNRVRPSHMALDGKVIDISTADFLPGEEPLCRCWAEPIK